MGITIQIDVEQDEYDRLKEIKDKHGVTWYGILRSGAIHQTKCQFDL